MNNEKIELLEEITRGDDTQVCFQRKDIDDNIIKTTPKKIYFTLKSNSYVEEAIFQKTIEDMYLDDDYVWHFLIESGDTDNLPYGSYFYDIEIINEADLTATIAKGFVEITDEATHKANEV